MPPSPSVASASFTPDASKPQLGFGIAHPGASKPLGTSHPTGAVGWTFTRAQPRHHSPRPEVKRSCRTPCRTEGARVRLMKALTFSLSTKLSHESCWGCSGSEGSASGWRARIASGRPVLCTGGSPCCPCSTPPAKSVPTPVPTPGRVEAGASSQRYEIIHKYIKNTQAAPSPLPNFRPLVTKATVEGGAEPVHPLGWGWGWPRHVPGNTRVQANTHQGANTPEAQGHTAAGTRCR